MHATGSDVDSPGMVACGVETPLGPMVAGSTERGVCLLEFVDRRALEAERAELARLFGCAWREGMNGHLERLVDELGRYFAGSLRMFGVALDTPGSSFERAVWERLLAIPHGATTSYERIAIDLGRPGASRAVGRANGRNRVAIVVPCHRVVQKDGGLCGYGGGLWRKRRLLEHEGASGYGGLWHEPDRAGVQNTEAPHG